MTVHEAKTHLSRLINRVLAGEEIIVSRGKEEVIRLVPVHPVSKPRRVGGWLAHALPPGKDPLDDGFWDPLPDEHLGQPQPMTERYLLDTHALVWWAFGSDRLPPLSRECIENPENIIFFSPVSAMEIATKVRIGKMTDRYLSMRVGSCPAVVLCHVWRRK